MSPALLTSYREENAIDGKSQTMEIDKRNRVNYLALNQRAKRVSNCMLAQTRLFTQYRHGGIRAQLNAR